MLEKFFSAKVNCQGQKNKSKKRTAKLLVVIVLLAVFLLIPQVKAATLDVGLSYAAQTGLNTQDIRITIATIIRVFLGFLGVTAIVIIIYGGYTWMTAAGNPEKIERAKKILINAAIGLLIILLAFAITQFILGQLLNALYGGGGPGTPGWGDGGGALGNGIIESHYPPRNATGIPRNTSIVVTFKEPMDVASIVNDNGTPNNLTDDFIQTNTTDNTYNVQIYPTPKTNETKNPVPANKVRVYYTTDLRTFVFKPVDLLGNPDTNTSYTVNLSTNIAKFDGKPAFGNYGPYYWKFEVSTIVDLTPPKVVSVIPFKDQTYPRNIIIQINFNEAINPLTLRGLVEIQGGGTLGQLKIDADGKIITFNYINVKTNDVPEKFVAGEFLYSNMYQTVEFVTNDLCGKNSCGGNVYCLPANKTITVLAKAAELVDTGKPTAKFPFTGIVDMADNSLDGDKSGTAEGPPSDNYVWNFSTNDKIDIIPPKIDLKTPEQGAEASPADSFEITFDKLMMSSTLKGGSNYGDGLEYITLDQSKALEIDKNISGWGYWITNQNLPQEIPTKTKAIINHAILGDYLPYAIKVNSGVKDIYQNCYQPCAGPSCDRVDTSTPGVYEAGAWVPNTNCFPSCDLDPTSTCGQ